MNKRHGTRIDSRYLLPVPAYLVLVAIFIVPVFTILKSAFIVEGHFSLSRLADIIGDPYTHRIMRFTIKQALDSTLLSLLLGLPGAFILAGRKVPLKKLINSICTIPFVLPSIFVVLGFVIFYGNNGVINSILKFILRTDETPLKILYSYKAIILAHSFYNFPVILILVENYLEHLDGRIEQASYTLGASRTRTFLTVTLPRIIPVIVSSCLLVFLFCFTSFSIILVLGGGPKFTTIEVEIYSRARMQMDNAGASGFSLFSILISTVILIFYIYFQKKSAMSEYGISRTVKRKVSAGMKVFSIIYGLIMAFFVLGPVFGIIIKSFYTPASRTTEAGFTLKWYKMLFGLMQGTGHMGNAFESIITSFIIAFTVSVLSIPMATTISYAASSDRKFFSSVTEIMGMLPMAVSSVIIGLGYFIIASKVRAGRTMGFFLIILAHLVVSVPFAIRTILPEMRKLPASYARCAQTLGASKTKTFFTITIPMLKGAILNGCVFAFAMSMGEINATLTLASSKIVTLPIVMYRLIGSYNYNGACAMGTILIIICLIVFLVSESTKRSRYE